MGISHPFPAQVAAEESVEALLEEISEFEQGVTQLEKEMHQLSRIESEAVGVLDEEAKYELREQKMRLDREFRRPAAATIFREILTGETKSNRYRHDW